MEKESEPKFPEVISINDMKNKFGSIFALKLSIGECRDKAAIKAKFYFPQDLMNKPVIHINKNENYLAEARKFIKQLKILDQMENMQFFEFFEKDSLEEKENMKEGRVNLSSMPTGGIKIEDTLRTVKNSRHKQGAICKIYGPISNQPTSSLNIPHKTGTVAIFIYWEDRTDGGEQIKCSSKEYYISNQLLASFLNMDDQEKIDYCKKYFPPAMVLHKSGTKDCNFKFNQLLGIIKSRKFLIFKESTKEKLVLDMPCPSCHELIEHSDGKSYLGSNLFDLLEAYMATIIYTLPEN